LRLQTRRRQAEAGGRLSHLDNRSTPNRSAAWLWCTTSSRRVRRTAARRQCRPRRKCAITTDGSPRRNPPRLLWIASFSSSSAYGTDTIAPRRESLPPDLRGPAFAVAVDLVLADGQASIEERRFIDRLQPLLEISDDDAPKIVDVMIVENSA
jgi:hypothetical protein